MLACVHAWQLDVGTRPASNWNGDVYKQNTTVVQSFCKEVDIRYNIIQNRASRYEFMKQRNVSVLLLAVDFRCDIETTFILLDGYGFLVVFEKH